MNPTWLDRHFASSVSLRLVISVSPTVMLPASGLSMPAIMLSSVVFPDPDGPISARNSASGTRIVILERTGISILSRWYDLLTLLTVIIGRGSCETSVVSRVAGRLLLHPDPVSGGERCIGAVDQAITLRETPGDFHPVSGRRPC